MSAPTARMPLRAALEAVRSARRDEDVVVTTMGPAREWMAAGAAHARDLVFIPSCMGHATSFGLGIALAQPERRVVVCNGDGSMLMNLGSLVTIAAAAPRNLVVLIFDNGVYEVTGAQPTAGSPEGRTDGSRVDFAAVARASGFEEVHSFANLADWTERISAVLERPGPTLAWLDVEPMHGQPAPRSPGYAPDRARRFMEALV